MKGRTMSWLKYFCLDTSDFDPCYFKSFSRKHVSPYPVAFFVISNVIISEPTRCLFAFCPPLCLPDFPISGNNPTTFPSCRSMSLGVNWSPLLISTPFSTHPCFSGPPLVLTLHDQQALHCPLRLLSMSYPWLYFAVMDLSLEGLAII